MSENRERDFQIKVLEERMNNQDRRLEDFRREFERWQNQQDKDIDEIRAESRTGDKELFREASDREMQRYGRGFNAFITIGSVILGALLTLLFSIYIGK